MPNMIRKWVESDAREVKRIGKIADKVMSYADDFAKLSDEELQAKTPAFKERLAQGETLDDILPEAFAVAREGARRVLACTHTGCRSSVELPCTKGTLPK